MLRPILFVGVGGSGGKTLRALKETLHRRLRQSDWDEGIPSAWQFLQIDTTYDGVEFPAPMLPLNEFVGLVHPGENYASKVTAIKTKIQGQEATKDALSGWLFPRSSVPIIDGAGQIRTIGRTVSAASLGLMKDRIKESISLMQAPGAAGQLLSLSNKLHGVNGESASGLEKPPMVIVISSIAGGSGAGMVLDVTETIKSVDPAADWLQNQHAFLYTPEVFNSIDASQRAQIPMNALGAMAEVMAGSWSTSASRATNTLFDANGVQVLRNGNKPGVGPVATYLIGATNANGVNLASGKTGEGMNEVFMAVGEALSGLVTDERIAESFAKHFYVNVFVNSGLASVVADRSGLTRSSDTTERMPFGSMGFARLTVGMDRLLEYASDGLVRNHVETLLFPDYEPPNPLNPVRPSVLIEREVNASYEEFVQDSWLSEQHPKDQVINSLRGDNRNEPAWDKTPGREQEAGKSRRVRAKVLAEGIRSNLARNPQLSPANWRLGLTQQFSLELPRFLELEREIVENNAKVWAAALQEHFVGYVAYWVSQRGLEVTEKMLKRLHSDLLDVANQEMMGEASDLRANIATFDTSLANQLNVEMPVLPADNLQVNKAVNVLQAFAERHAEAELLEFTPKILIDIANNLVLPLAEACEVSLNQIRGDLQNATGGGAAANFKRFANLREDNRSGVVAPNYHPRQVERMLIKSDDFPQELQTIAQRDLPSELKASWFDSLTKLSLEGKPLRSLDAHVESAFTQKMIKVEVPWSPSEPRLRVVASTGAAKLEVLMPRSVDALKVNAREWLMEGDSAFGKQYRMSLNEFCNVGTTQQKLDKEKNFIEKFKDLVKLSAPLVGINENALQAVHHHSNAAQNPRGNNWSVSVIPFSAQSSIGRSCAEVLEGVANGITFDAASSAKDINAFSTVKVAMQPMAFSSLVEPIAQAWLVSSQTDEDRKAFWSGRRARPLLDAIPVSPEIRQSMIAGWYISYLFSHDRESIPAANLGKLVELWTQDGYLSFPYPLLPMTDIDTRALPAVLSSLSLAIIESGRIASLSPLAPYNRLRDLGREVTVPAGKDLWDGTDNPSELLIRNWIQKGSLPAGSPAAVYLGNPDESSGPIGTPADRKSKLQAVIVKWMNDYQKFWVDLSTESWEVTPQIFELRSDIDSAFEAIAAYVDSVNVAVGTGSSGGPR